MTQDFTLMHPTDEYWIDGHVGPSSPPYSPEAEDSERVIQTWSAQGPDTAGVVDEFWSPSGCFLYDSPLVSISLGRRVWGPRQPVYGFNGVVHGAVKLNQKCSHVFRLELLGKVKVTASNRGMIAGVVDRDLLTSTVVLSSPPSGKFAPTEQCFPFSIPWPSYVKGETSLLPPSYTVWSPAFSAEFEYCVRVDIYRKGLRRHEVKMIPILYFPKTWPSHPPPRSDAIFDRDVTPDGYKTITLPPEWPSDACPKERAKATMPVVQFSFPSGVTHASGHPIPLRVSIHSNGAPALAKLLIQGVEVQVIRRMVAWSESGHVAGGRENVICKGTLIETDTSQEGSAVSYHEVVPGEPGSEQSWVFTGVAEVAYFIRVAIACPKGTVNFIPTYKHIARIQVSSEPWGTRERELLQFGGVSAPAIRMGHARSELRPVSSVAW
ncbi:hypothetical protein BC834DRAFT_231787 [Gloeopeniophorella convolvens]|nr:hypothetical protein BC834DRAFT_231787 [Gloeopeniophorella convolvens]